MQGRFDKLMGALRVLGLGAALWAAAQGAGAGVTSTSMLTVGGDREGYRGESVSLTFFESDLRNFNSAVLNFSFNTNVLSFDRLGRDCATVPTPDDCGYLIQDLDSNGDPVADANGFATFSLALTTAPVDSNGVAELLTLQFFIKGTAAIGATDVTFTNFYGEDQFTGPTPMTDAAITYDRQSFLGTITVLDRDATALPILGTAPLALTALALLTLVSRRSRSTGRVSGQIPA